MKNMEFHNDFIPEGSQDLEGVEAVTLEAGLTWMEIYAAASIDRDLVIKIFMYYTCFVYIIRESFP